MDSKSGDPSDPIEMWLDHIAEEGCASLMPERAFPGLELGYTSWQGRSKRKLQHVVSLQLMYLTLGDLYLLIGRPGGQYFWQLVAEGGGVAVPMPGQLAPRRRRPLRLRRCRAASSRQPR